MPLTDDEYEDAYQEALFCLQEEATVGYPVIGPEGERTCRVDGMVLNDYEVLQRWWGKDIADIVCEDRKH